MKKKICRITLLIFLLLGFLWSKKTFLYAKPVFAQSCQGTCLDINTYQTSYADLKKVMGYTNRILNFSGTTYISEFDDDSRIYAGHLGSFWAPLGKDNVFSAHSTYWRNAFAHGLLFYNRDNGDHDSEDVGTGGFDKGTWYPSKLVVTQEYTRPFTGRITGIKTAIPGQQGFSLKLKIENIGASPLNLNLLSFSMVNSIARSFTIFYSRTDNDPANKNGTFRYDDSKQAVVFSAPNVPNAHLAIGYDGNHQLISYRFENQGPNPITADFFDNGILDSVGSDSADIDGSEAALVTQLPTIPAGQIETLTIYFVFGSTADNALTNLVTLRNQDIEALSDSFWNQRLANLGANIPSLKINDSNLERVYQNSILNLAMNLFQDTSGKYFYGLSDHSYLAQFPWQAISIGSIWAWGDPAGFKGTLKNFIRLDMTKCKAYNPNPIEGAISHCPNDYAYNPSTVVLAVYEYLTITKDWGFLDEQVFGKAMGQEKTQTVLQWLREIAYFREPTDPNKLADYGNDNELYEMRDSKDKTGKLVVCNLKGLYTGKVPSPNAERYWVHKKLAEIYKKRGDTDNAEQEETMVGSTKIALNLLWNEEEGWFDSLSQNGVYNNFRAVWLFHLLDFQGLLTPLQKSRMLEHLNEYEAPYGFYSISKLDELKWCLREDWHGPGTYIGETGKMVATLAQNKSADKALQITRTLDYLAISPYFAQCTSGDNNRFSLAVPDGCGGIAYLEGASFAQAFITGFFGIQPTTNGLRISPAIPAELINKGMVSLGNLKIGNNTYIIDVDPTMTVASLISTGSQSYKITVPNNQKFILENNLIFRDPDINDNEQVDSQDIVILLQNWGPSPATLRADLNNDGLVNGFDFEKLRKLIP